MLGSVVYFLKLSFPCLRRGFGRQAVEGEEIKMSKNDKDKYRRIGRRWNY
jgi:hypothetical protein